MMFSEHAEPIPAARVAQISSFDFCSSVQTPNPRINAGQLGVGGLCLPLQAPGVHRLHGADSAPQDTFRTALATRGTWNTSGQHCCASDTWGIRLGTPRTLAAVLS